VVSAGSPHGWEVLVGKSDIIKLPFEVVLPYNSTMKSLRPVILILLCVILSVTLAYAQSAKTTPFHPTTAVSGKVLYGQYCAVCHGIDGKGSGPAAVALKQRPTDLTQLNHQNGGLFPEEHFMKMMNGELSTAAHGSANMPIWGSDFRKTASNPNLAQDRIYSLMNYIEGMQTK